MAVAAHLETRVLLIVTPLITQETEASHTSHNAGDSGIYSITADSGTTYYGSTPEEVAERERQEKKQQRREARAEVANTIKAKRNETTKKSEKIRLAVTWLTLKLHL